MTKKLLEVLRSQLSEYHGGFSIGGFGAIAEFQDEDAEILDRPAHLVATSARGAFQVELEGQEVALAYETRGSKADSWQYRLAILAEASSSRMSGRTVLTELGVDKQAVREADRKAVLFDLGAGFPHIDFCVRTDDNEMIDCLRKHVGDQIMHEQHPLLDRIIDASPQRVVLSRVARIEVYQRIDRHQTLAGPHTHLLPKLIKHRRTHSAIIPVPYGWIPMLTVHPENPLFDALGVRRPFVGDVFNRFEQLLADFGDPDYVQEKYRLREAVEAKIEPTDYEPGNSRVARLAQQIALRQLGYTGADRSILDRWATLNQRR